MTTRKVSSRAVQQGVGDDDMLRLALATVQRFSEIASAGIRQDLERLPTVGPEQQSYLSAYWWRFVEAMLAELPRKSEHDREWAALLEPECDAEREHAAPVRVRGRRKRA